MAHSLTRQQLDSASQAPQAEERRTCPVEGCGAAIHQGVLMCRHDWRRVPQRLRREVNATWNAFRRSKDRNVIGQRRIAYEFAVNAAVAAATGARVIESKDGGRR